MTDLCPRCGHPMWPTVEEACRQALSKGRRLPSLTDLQRACHLSRHTVIKRRREFLRSLQNTPPVGTYQN